MCRTDINESRAAGDQISFRKPIVSDTYATYCQGIRSNKSRQQSSRRVHSRMNTAHRQALQAMHNIPAKELISGGHLSNVQVPDVVIMLKRELQC